VVHDVNVPLPSLAGELLATVWSTSRPASSSSLTTFIEAPPERLKRTTGKFQAQHKLLQGQNKFICVYAGVLPNKRWHIANDWH
jgi:hypothetical protein